MKPVTTSPWGAHYGRNHRRAVNNNKQMLAIAYGTQDPGLAGHAASSTNNRMELANRHRSLKSAQKSLAVSSSTSKPAT